MSYLNKTFSWRCWRAIQEAVIKRVPLGKAQPLREIWEILPVALKNHGVIVQASSFIAKKIKWTNHADGFRYLEMVA